MNLSALTPSDWAAWVQAGGSLVGIGVAIVVPFVLSRQDRKRFEREQRVRAKSYALALLPRARRLESMLASAERRLREPDSYLELQELADGLRQRASELNLPLEIRELGEIAHPLLDGIASTEKLSSLLEDHEHYVRHGGEFFDANTGDSFPISEPEGYEVVLGKARLQIEDGVRSMLTMFE